MKMPFVGCYLGRVGSMTYLTPLHGRELSSRKQRNNTSEGSHRNRNTSATAHVLLLLYLKNVVLVSRTRSHLLKKWRLPASVMNHRLGSASGPRVSLVHQFSVAIPANHNPSSRGATRTSDLRAMKPSNVEQSTPRTESNTSYQETVCRLH